MDGAWPHVNHRFTNRRCGTARRQSQKHAGKRVYWHGRRSVQIHRTSEKPLERVFFSVKPWSTLHRTMHGNAFALHHHLFQVLPSAFSDVRSTVTARRPGRSSLKPRPGALADNLHTITLGMRRTAAGGSKLFGHKDGLGLRAFALLQQEEAILSKTAKAKMMVMQGLLASCPTRLATAKLCSPESMGLSTQYDRLRRSDVETEGKERSGEGNQRRM